MRNAADMLRGIMSGLSEFREFSIAALPILSMVGGACAVSENPMGAALADVVAIAVFVHYIADDIGLRAWSFVKSLGFTVGTLGAGCMAGYGVLTLS